MDLIRTEIRKQKFTCDSNGMWQGEWPVCLPKQTCSKLEITDIDPSIQLEHVGNVYYINETDWYAIDFTWVHYSCIHHEGIMVGKPERTCFNGKWSNKMPHCTTGTHF